jgi:hypothetical protein
MTLSEPNKEVESMKKTLVTMLVVGLAAGLLSFGLPSIAEARKMGPPVRHHEGGGGLQEQRGVPPIGPSVPTYDSRFYDYKDGKLIPKPNAPKPGQGGAMIQDEDEWVRRTRVYNERLQWYNQRIAELTDLINRYRQHENDRDLDKKQREHARQRRIELERERARLEIGRSGLTP